MFDYYAQGTGTIRGGMAHKIAELLGLEAENILSDRVVLRKAAFLDVISAAMLQNPKNKEMRMERLIASVCTTKAIVPPELRHGLSSTDLQQLFRSIGQEIDVRRCHTLVSLFAGEESKILTAHDLSVMLDKHAQIHARRRSRGHHRRTSEPDMKDLLRFQQAMKFVDAPAGAEEPPSMPEPGSRPPRARRSSISSQDSLPGLPFPGGRR